METFALATCNPPSAGQQESTGAKETLQMHVRVQLGMLNKQTAHLKHRPAALQLARGMAVPRASLGIPWAGAACSSVITHPGKLGNKVISLNIRCCKKLGAGRNWLMGSIWHREVWGSGCSIPGGRERESSRSSYSNSQTFGISPGLTSSLSPSRDMSLPRRLSWRCRGRAQPSPHRGAQLSLSGTGKGCKRGCSVAWNKPIRVGTFIPKS